MNVVVVGAGLAGLTAAWSLHGSGVEVRVLEARDRVGGRAFSHTLDNGAVVERGGEFIEIDHHAIRGLCAELSIPLIPHGVTFHRRPIDGETPTAAEIQAAMAEVTRYSRSRLARHGADFAVDEAFASALGSSFRSEPAYRRFVTSLAADPAEASARHGLLDADHVPFEHAARARGGNQRIATEMWSRLEPSVELGSAAVGVATDSGRVVIARSDGSELAADAAVLAVPMPLLSSIDWRHGLPEPWARALDQLGFGHAAKLSAGLIAGAPPRAQQASQASWWSWNSMDETATTSVRAVSAFAGGSAVQESLNLDGGAPSWIDQLERQRPDLSLEPGSALVTRWDGEPWTRGAYSYGRVGWEADVDEALRRPQGALVLAGEHTAGTLAGTLNGAVASGNRAAADVRRLLSL